MNFQETQFKLMVNLD